MSKTISDIFFERSWENPLKTAIIYKDNSYSYSRIRHLVLHQIADLQDSGLTHGDHLISQLENDVDFIVLMLAAAYLGVVLVPLDPKLDRRSLSRMSLATDSNVMLSEPPDIFRIKAKLIDGLDEKSPSQVGNPFLIITTSGSTGDPKPILLTQKTKLARVKMMNDLYSITADDTILISTPMYHSMGQRLALVSLLNGGTLVIMGNWNAERFLDQVETHQVTFAVPVASQIKQVVQVMRQFDQRLKSLRWVVSSSAPLESNIRRRLEAGSSFKFSNCYGTTEVSIATSSDPLGPTDSVGIPIPNAQIALTGDSEIVVKTDLMFDGYYKNPKLTQDSMINGYFRTGDLGWADEWGNLFIKGRIKEMINVGGTKVYPMDVEEVVNTIPGVKESAAYPYPDETFGEVVGIAIVMDEGRVFPDLNLATIQYHCLSLLSDAQLPRTIRVLDQLPKTETGKIQRVKLTRS